MIAAAAIGGLCGFWIWVVLNDDGGILKPVSTLLQKTDITSKWMRCPWCSGAWFAIAACLLVFHVSVATAVVVAIAAAAVTGILGSYFQGE